MKQVGQLAQQVMSECQLQGRQSHSTTPSSELMPDVRPRIIQLFSQFQGRYARKWIKDYPTEELTLLAMSAWNDELNDFSDAAIDIAYKAWRGPWPPTAEDFRDACQGVKASWRSKQKCLPKPNPDPEIAKQHLHYMRRVIGGLNV